MVDVVENINALLEIQGLDLTEVLDHNNLSNLLIECRDEIDFLRDQIESIMSSDHDLHSDLLRAVLQARYEIFEHAKARGNIRLSDMGANRG